MNAADIKRQCPTPRISSITRDKNAREQVFLVEGATSPFEAVCADGVPRVRTNARSVEVKHVTRDVWEVSCVMLDSWERGLLAMGAL